MNSTKYTGEYDSFDTLWELREIDAWADQDVGWTWNDSFFIKRFRSNADDLKGLFLRVLADINGKPLPRGVFRVEDSDWNILEVRRRKDGCPVWAMIRITPQ